jgi:hypothetical protein
MMAPGACIGTTRFTAPPGSLRPRGRCRRSRRNTPRYMPAPCRFMKLWRRGRSGLDAAEAFCKPAPATDREPDHDRATQTPAHRNARSPWRAPLQRRGRGRGLSGGALRRRHGVPAREVPRVVQDGGMPPARYRAFYPEIRITTTTYSQVDTRLAFGHVAEPGTYMTTVTRPDPFGNYLRQQIGLLIQNHGVRSMSARRHADPGAFRRAERCRGAGPAGRRDVLPAARRLRRAGPAIDP